MHVCSFLSSATVISSGALICLRASASDNGVPLTALPAFLLTSAHPFPGDDRYLPTAVADGKLDEHALGKPGEIPS